MSIRIREMVYHKIKLNKILSRVSGKPEEQVECLLIWLPPFFYNLSSSFLVHHFCLPS